jgi:hypothetical protein
MPEEVKWVIERISHFQMAIKINTMATQKRATYQLANRTPRRRSRLVTTLDVKLAARLKRATVAISPALMK